MTSGNLELYSAPGIERLVVPEALQPETTDAVLPVFSAADLAELKASGWSRVGIVAAVVDDRERFLMLEHRPSDKTPSGAWGPLAETTQLARTGPCVHVERTADTLARGLREEVGVADPAALEVTARYAGSWILNRWPVGGRHVAQFALAVCPVVHIDRETRLELEDSFRPNEETGALAFMYPEQIAGLDHVRYGTHTWLHQVMYSGLAALAAQERDVLRLSAGLPLPNATDAKLLEIDYL